MKGVVFTEFLEMVEEAYSFEMVDRIIEASELGSGGAYTSVGTYDHRELVQLVVNLGRFTDEPVPDLVRRFGEYMFVRFFQMFPVFFAESDTAFSFLAKVEGYIHIEVRKLYPDAELPSLLCETPEPGRFIMCYRSNRDFADLAHGLILGWIAHFGEQIEVRREADVDPLGTFTRFTLTK